MAARKSMSKKTRFEVFKRDCFTCQYCGGVPPVSILHVDHINPVSKGDANNQDNLITACSACGLGKGAALLSSIPKSLTEKAEEIKEREQQIAGYAQVMQEKIDRIEDQAWIVVEAYGSNFLEGINKRKFHSIKKFVELIGFHETLEAMQTARAKIGYNDTSTFLYFCGICWRKFREASE